MVKAYLRFQLAQTWGDVHAPPSNVVHTPDGRFLVTAALENATLWDLRTGELVRQLVPPGAIDEGASSASTARWPGEVTRLAVSPDGRTLAAGHADGGIRVWDLTEFTAFVKRAGVGAAALRSGGDRRSGTASYDELDEDAAAAPPVPCVATLAGHRSAVSALRFSADGSVLASGGRDTDVVLWDVAGEAGICRLRGHVGEVTDLAFLEPALGAGSEEVEEGGRAEGGEEEGTAKAAQGGARPNGKGAGKEGGAADGLAAPSLPALLLLSTSKDGTLRVWDPEARHCRQIVGTAKGEAWSVDVDPTQSRVALGAADDALRWFGVLGSPGAPEPAAPSAAATQAGASPDAPSASELPDVLLPMSYVRRRAPERCAYVRFFVAGKSSLAPETLLMVQSTGKVVEVFRLRDADDAQRHARRRVKRKVIGEEKKKKKKRTAEGKGDDADEGADEDGGDDGAAGAPAASPTLAASDELEAWATVRSKHRVRACCWVAERGRGRRGARAAGRAGPAAETLATLALATANNAVETWRVGGDGEDAERDAEAQGLSLHPSTRVADLRAPGSRAEVRAVAWTGDDRLAVAAGAGGADVWNPWEGRKARGIECEYLVSVLTAPGNRHAVLGAKSGALLIVDLLTGEILETVADAHARGSAVWGLAHQADGSGFVSAGGDGKVRFWSWSVRKPEPDEDEEEDDESGDEESEDEESEGGSKRGKKKASKKSKTKKRKEKGKGASAGASSTAQKFAHLSATLEREMEMKDDALAVRCTKDGRLVAVALLDASIRVFFADSLKFFTALYGHSLPALALDASDDGSLLVSGGADRNVRIWGLDYGDCRRSLHAHADAVTALAFQPGTHYFFSAGKDGLVKYWDADKHTLLLEMRGHLGPCWSIALSHQGDAVLSGGADRSLRRWERTDEPFFAEEEAERRLESLFDAEESAQSGRRELGDPTARAAQAAAEAPDAATLAAARASTAAGAAAADQLAEALELAGNEERRGVEEELEKRERDAEAEAERTGRAVEDVLREMGAVLVRRSEPGEPGAAAASTVVALPPASARAMEALGLPPTLLDPASPDPRPSRDPSPFLLGQSPSEHVKGVLRRVRGADLEAALVALPFGDALRLLAYLARWLAQSPADVERLTRTASLLLRLHAPRLSKSPAARAVLDALRGPLAGRIRQARDALGVNLAAIEGLEARAARDVAARQGVGVMDLEREKAKEALQEA